MRMGFSLGLAAYLFLSERLTGYANAVLEKRLANGKEDPDRISERRGEPGLPRQAGTLIWFHAASVGESLSLLTLIEQIEEEFPDVHILVTTGTRTSADLMQTRLPFSAVHQLVPVDARPFVRRFLDHWRPDIAIWTESELWPALISETARRGTRMLLLNARMSERSHDKWRWLPGIARAVLRSFDHIFVQDVTTARHLRRLGAPSDRVEVSGSIKESGGALPYVEEDRAHLAEKFKTRPVWLAASTHEGEEAAAAAAHRVALRSSHRLLLIIAPRHPERAAEIVKSLRDDGWHVSVRSDGQEPDPSTQIYVADTLGEMGLWYRLAPVTFLGGSLVPVGGHNPYEPAALGSAILHGPHTDSAEAIYDQLDEAGGARKIKGADELAKAVVELLEPNKAAMMAHAAWEVTSSGAGAAEKAFVKIADFIDDVEGR
jgi:3-deoxy-D-manno-octulosonic-acid transferase